MTGRHTNHVSHIILFFSKFIVNHEEWLAVHLSSPNGRIGIDQGAQLVDSWEVPVGAFDTGGHFHDVIASVVVFVGANHSVQMNSNATGSRAKARKN